MFNGGVFNAFTFDGASLVITVVASSPDPIFGTGFRVGPDPSQGTAIYAGADPAFGTGVRVGPDPSQGTFTVH